MSVTIGNITNRIKSNKQNIKIHLNANPDFEQSNTIKKRVKQNLDKLNADEHVQEQGDIVYNEHEVINIPKKLDNLFDNLLCDNYYLYGISIHSVSFINSLLYIILSDFKFKNNEEQKKFSVQLKDNLINDIGIYFKKNKYSKNGFKKSLMEENIENNIFECAELHYISDYYNINLVVLDYYKFTYYTGSNYNESNNNVIIIKYNDIYLPLIHIFGEYPDNLVYKCIINKLKVNNLTATITNAIDNDNDNDNGNEEPNAKVELNLKAMSSYKLNDLETLVKKYNIDISGKKKTKKILYEALSGLLE
jgi:hypothetical protein